VNIIGLNKMAYIEKILNYIIAFISNKKE